MRHDQVVRAMEGKQRRIEHVKEIKVPDVWHTMQAVRRQIGKPKSPFKQTDYDQLHELWSLAHDLLKHVKRICREKKK